MFKVFTFTLIGGISFMFGSAIDTNTDPGKEKVIQRAVMGILDQYHYSPEDLDDEFSEEAYDYFLNYVDSRKRFFTQEDLQQLEGYRTLIDDHINQGSFEFFNLATEILQKRVDAVGDIYSIHLEETFDFELDESFEFDPENKNWPLDDQQLNSDWRKQLKYDVLVALTSRLTKQEKAIARLEKDAEDEDERKKDAELAEKTYDELEIEARAKVKDDYDKWYKNFQKVRRSDRFESYLNTFAHMFDPHSDYFNPKEKKQFDIDMGGKLEGIGARLRTDGDLTKVVSIVPGGPVWKNKMIEVNDKILRVKQVDEESVDIFGMRIDDVVSQIRGKKGTMVTLFIEKKDGSTIEVELERDVINIQESFAKSAILDLGGKIDKIGYIDLPKFYSTFDGPEGNSCAVDVSNEIKKLKSNNINGLILDLRSNGGGSLKDVIDMSGLFIEEGPIVQVKPRDRRPYVYKDEDETVQYDGPLIVMINSFSASASEILAAAMQDYDRAIIVGSQSFGKGTVQRFIDLDKAVKGNKEIKPLGQLKLTMQKFYRINGGSTQLRGVTPDISLPDRYRLIDVGEREYDNAMEWSQLSTLEYDQNVFEVTNKDYLKKNSEERLAKDESFAMIKEQGTWYKQSRDKTSYSLNLNDHRSYLKQKKQRSDKYKSLNSQPIEGLKVSNLSVDLETINLDEKTSASNEDWLKNLNKDIYLEETLLIMKDMIEGASYTSVPKKVK